MRSNQIGLSVTARAECPPPAYSSVAEPSREFTYRGALAVHQNSGPVDPPADEHRRANRRNQHGAGLAGAVGSEQAENMRRRNLEREIVNGCKAAVRLSHPEQFDGRSQRLNDYTGSVQKRTAGGTPAPSVKTAPTLR